MSPQASKRTGAAASRGGAGSPPPGGFLQSPPPSPADVNAAQARSRTNRFIQSRPASAATTRRMPNFGRGASPRPLSGMDIGARLAADQARDRQVAQNQPTSSSASAADGDTLLELPTRSYTRPEPTAEEQEMDRQKGMLKTQRQFQTPEGAAEAAPGGGGGALQAQTAEPAPERRTDRNRGPQEPEEIAQQLLEEQQRERQTETEQGQPDEAIAKQERIERFKSNQLIRDIIKWIQFITSISVITAITLVLQMHLEMLNKWIFKKRIPGIIEVEENPTVGAREMATLGIDFAVLFSCAGCAFLLIVPFGMAYAISHPIQTAFLYMKHIFFPGL